MFTSEDRKKLAINGFVIYPFKGESILAYKYKEGRLFAGNHFLIAQCERSRSRLSEVAINPDKFFLPNSNNKTLSEQQEMVDTYSQDLQQRFQTNGIVAIIGQVPDYVELTFTHLTSVEKRLFGKRHNYDFTKTETQLATDITIAHVGCYVSDTLHIYDWFPNNKNEMFWAAPLIVPKVS